MKRLIALLVLLAFLPFASGIIWVQPARFTTGGGSGGTPSLIDHKAAGGTSASATTASADTTGANLLVVHVTYYWPTVGTVTVSDSKSNTWSELTEHTASTLYSSRIYYCYGGTVGTGHTFTVSTTTGYPSIQIAAFSNVASSPFDQEAGNTASDWTTISSGSISPSQTNTIAVVGLGFSDNSAGTISIDSSYTITDTTPFASGMTIGGSLAWKLPASTSAQNPTWTTSSSSAYGATSHATFKY